jgi:putative glutamine amidotransferase
VSGKDGKRRPTIGVTAATERVSYGAWREIAAHVSPERYAAAVQRAGARAVLLVPDPEDAENPEGVLELIDGLILTGGAGDVDPALYGEEPHPETGPVQEVRDEYEFALARAAVEREMPVLGICRGMQILNVLYGGSIEQHLPDALGHEEHRHTPGVFADHEVRLEPGSLAARATGADASSVKSHHHQGIKQVGEGLATTGWTAGDDTVEAVEDPGRPFVLGVLWHPEEDEKSRLIRALVEEASQ